MKICVIAAKMLVMIAVTAIVAMKSQVIGRLMLAVPRMSPRQ